MILYCGIELECSVDFNKQIKQAEYHRTSHIIIGQVNKAACY